MNSSIIGQDATKTRTIEGDLGTALECQEPLHIKGAILSGVKLLSHAALTVDGPIQDAEVVCHGDLLAHGGIDMNGLGRIVAKSNLTTRFIKGAQVEIEKDLHVALDITDSTVRSRNTVTVGGAIAGGEVGAASALTANLLGRPGQKMDETKVEAGMNFRLKIMREEMDREVAEVTSKAEKIRAAVKTLETKEKSCYTGLPIAERKLLKSTKESLDILEKQLLGLRIRQQKLAKKLEPTTSAYIEVRDKILPGTRISIQHRFVVAPKEYPAGKFTICDDKICRL